MEDKIMEDKELIKILKVIANKNRFLILRLLHKHKELSVGDLAEATSSPFRSVSRDLFYLRKANLFQTRNQYSSRFYSIDVKNIPKDILRLF